MNQLNFPSRPLRFLLLGLLLMPLAGCRPKKPAAKVEPVQFSRELPAGQLALRKLSPAEYPDFTLTPLGNQDPARVLQAIDRSLEYLKAPSSKSFFPYLDITHDRAIATLRALRDVYEREVVQAPGNGGGAGLNAAIRAQFDVYKSIGGFDAERGKYVEKVLFTGYCTPVYPASLTREGAYQWPLYKRPADLVADDDARKAAGRRAADGSIAPHFTRAEIERDGKLAGGEFVWLANRFDAYVITVQGSAVLRLPDGRELEVGYSGFNGHEYVSPIRQMVKDGLIQPDQVSLTTMRAYFDAHPDAMDKYLWLNPRTVFFTERPGGPFGSLNVKVTPLATIATDKAVYPRAMPAFLVVPLSRGPGGGGDGDGGGDVATRAFMLDQDTGGAIRAAGRCDIYMGIGPEAEATAGRQLHEGELYYLAVKEKR